MTSEIRQLHICGNKARSRIICFIIAICIAVLSTSVFAQENCWSYAGYIILDDGGSRVFQFQRKDNNLFIFAKFNQQEHSLGAIKYSENNDLQSFRKVNPKSSEEAKLIKIIQASLELKTIKSNEIEILRTLQKVIHDRPHVWPEEWMILNH